MKQEYIPRNKTAEHATSLGQQILYRARQEAYKQGRPTDIKLIKDLVNKMVNRFTSNVLAAADEEVSFF